MLFSLPILALSFAATTQVELQQVQLEPTLLSAITLSQPSEPEKIEEPISTQWGQEGSWRWGIHGGYAEGMTHHDNEIILLGVEFDYFIADQLSLDIGLNLLDITQTGGNTDGFNATLQLRWHAIAEKEWSFFIEGGAGLLFTEDNVPSDGSDFNFTPQVGLGFTFDASDSARWLIGLRWHHISNANTYRSNPGRDSLMLWAGMTFPF
ncbi:MAG: acyloxyacyl hydrolase [Planctomycetes bacterium]|nr:acyloxyacyl hydrolase [Planctomycetota bacterium]